MFHFLKRHRHAGHGHEAFHGGPRMRGLRRGRSMRHRHEAEESREIPVRTMHAGYCPMCKNHCPLDAPGCDRGQAFARQGGLYGQGERHE